MTHSLPPTEKPDGPTQHRGYEARDLRRWSLPIAVISFLVGAAALHFATFGLYRYFRSRPLPTDAPNSAVSQSLMPTNGNLPPLEAEDVRLLRERENAIFRKLGWDAKGNSAEVTIPDAIVTALAARQHP